MKSERLNCLNFHEIREINCLKSGGTLQGGGIFAYTEKKIN